MDTKLTKKSNKPKIIIFSILGIVILAALYWLAISSNQSYAISAKDLTIRSVKKGKFEDVLIATGKVESSQSVWVNAIEGGSVVEKWVETGDMVKEGQVLAVLKNPNTELNFMTQETNIIENINQLNSSIITLRNQSLEMEKEQISMQNDYQLAKEDFKNKQKLYDAEIIPRTDYIESKTKFEYQNRRKSVINQSMENERKANNQQIVHMNKTIHQLQKSLQILRSNKGNFIVKATASGRLSDFDPQIGQFVNSGDKLGKIDLMQGYKLNLKLDEYHLNKIDVGVEGTLEADGKTYEVITSKILPEVKNGQFSTEVLFKNEMPEGLKLGQTFTVKLRLSKDTEGLLLNKGTFYGSTSGNWVYVVEGGKATKKNIEIGNENNLYYQVLSGLNEGDKVIVSDYEDFKQYDKLEISD